MRSNSAAVLELNNISKSYGDIKALADIDYTFSLGIYGILGPNGAGKSTLMKIISQSIKQTSGEVLYNGKTCDRSFLNCLGVMPQGQELYPKFSVNEFMFYMATLKNMKTKKAKIAIPELLKVVGLADYRHRKIESLSGGMKQRLLIAQALLNDPKIILFDEPTAVLTPQEIKELMMIMRNLKAEGKSILFISHKLNEIMEVADRCTVLRRGKYVGTVETKDTSMEELSAMMVGRDVNFHVEKKPAHIGDAVLKVSNLTVASKRHKNDAVKNVSFEVHAGEIVCIAGIDGNGQSELVYGLTGLEPIKSGKIEFLNEDVTKRSIRHKTEKGMAHIPEDRHKYGLVLDYTLADNFILQTYYQNTYSTKFGGFMKRDAIIKNAEKIIEKYDVRSSQGPNTIVRSMSGGNQQKAIIGREIDRDPELLIAVQPTRGLDIGAIEYIHSQLVKQRDEGKAVLLISLELEEVLDVSDRILVMYEGEIVGELDPHTVSEEELGLYMAGAKRNEVKA